jgi:hypothetical protein
MSRAGMEPLSQAELDALEAPLEDVGYGVRDHLAEVIESRGEDRGIGCSPR